MAIGKQLKDYFDSEKIDCDLGAEPPVGAAFQAMMKDPRPGHFSHHT